MEEKWSPVRIKAHCPLCALPVSAELRASDRSRAMSVFVRTLPKVDQVVPFSQNTKEMMSRIFLLLCVRRQEHVFGVPATIEMLPKDVRVFICKLVFRMELPVFMSSLNNDVDEIQNSLNIVRSNYNAVRHWLDGELSRDLKDFLFNHCIAVYEYYKIRDDYPASASLPKTMVYNMLLNVWRETTEYYRKLLEWGEKNMDTLDQYHALIDAEFAKRC